MRKDLARIADGLESIEGTLASIDRTLGRLVDVIEIVTTPVRLLNAALTHKFLN
jgi:hypothetical protein